MAKKKTLLDATLEKFNSSVGTPTKEFGQTLSNRYATPPKTSPVKEQLKEMFNPDKSVFYQKALELYNKFSQKKPSTKK